MNNKHTTDTVDHMEKKVFRHPKEIKARESKVPLSIRIKITTKARLESAAKKHSLSLAELVSAVLDDYVEWLKEV